MAFLCIYATQRRRYFFNPKKKYKKTATTCSTSGTPFHCIATWRNLSLPVPTTAQVGQNISVWQIPARKLFFKVYFFIYLKGIMTKRGRDRERDLPLVGPLLTWPWWLELGQTKSRRFLGVSHIDTGVWAPGPSSLLLWHIGRELDWEWSSQDWVGTHMGCQGHRQQLNRPCHNARPRKFYSEGYSLNCITTSKFISESPNPSCDTYDLVWKQGLYRCNSLRQAYSAIREPFLQHGWSPLKRDVWTWIRTQGEHCVKISATQMGWGLPGNPQVLAKSQGAGPLPPQKETKPPTPRVQNQETTSAMA